MLKAKSIIILFIVLNLISNFIFAQMEDDFRMEEEKKPTKKIKEVESVIDLWNISDYAAFQDSLTIDTTLDIYHIYHPAFKSLLTASYLGNYGTPYLNNDFFGRESNLDFLFAKTREAYMLTPSNIKYYNTTTPYTLLDFSQSENKSRKSETRFNVLHSQNVSPYLNFTFRFDQAKSIGQYSKQMSKNNLVTLYSSYNKDNWNIYTGFILNSVKNEENGGLLNDSLILEPEDTDFLKMNLSDSKNAFNSVYFFNNSEYQVGKYIEIDDSTEYFRPLLGMMYSFQYERHKQEFFEDEEFDSLFWDNTYLDKGYLTDFIEFNKLSNVLQIKQYENADKKVTFGKRVFLGHEYANYSYPGEMPSGYKLYKYENIKDQLTNPYELYRNNSSFSNLYVGGGIFRETGNFWNWKFDGKIYLLGRNAGQTEINGIISKPFNFLGDSLAAVIFEGSIENVMADPFQEKFYSNHYRWDNDFQMEQRMTVGAKFVSKMRKLEIGGKYAILNNYIYNDMLGIPSQTSKELIVLSAYLDKDFNYRNLHFRTRLLWQKASEESLIHLPVFSGFVSAYFQFIVSKVLYTQIGADTRYNTLYYADAYAPSTGLFYLQNEKKYGDFPYIDVYATIRLKRTTLFFKLMNIGTNFIQKEYITTPNYPMNRSTFRLGVKWAFFD